LLPPGSLHDSNIELEPSLVADAYRLLPSLTPTIRERVSDATWKASGFELRIVPGTVLVTGIDHSTDGRLLLKLDGECVTVGSNHPGVLSKFWEWVELSHESETVQHELSTLAYAGYEAVLVNGSESKAPAPLSPPVSAPSTSCWWAAPDKSSRCGSLCSDSLGKSDTGAVLQGRRRRSVLCEWIVAAYALSQRDYDNDTGIGRHHAGLGYGQACRGARATYRYRSHRNVCQRACRRK
jgi:hypothetical protein